MKSISLQSLQEKIEKIKINPPVHNGFRCIEPVVQYAAGAMDNFGFRQAITNPSQHPNNLNWSEPLQTEGDEYREDGACYLVPKRGEHPTGCFWSYDEAKKYNANGNGPRGQVAARILWAMGGPALTEWFVVAAEDETGDKMDWRIDLRIED